MGEAESLPLLPPCGFLSAESARFPPTTADVDAAKLRGAFPRRRDKPKRFMLRIRLTAGELHADQARAIAMISYDFGHGIADVTRRGDIQVQGVDEAKLVKAFQRLEEVGLTGRQTGASSVRTVVGHPLSGLLADDLVDTRPLCHAITERLLAEPSFLELPFKFNIALSGRPKHDLSLWTQDLAFLATDTAQGVAFQILVGGHHGERPRLARLLPMTVTAAELPHVAHAAVRFFNEGARHLPAGDARDRRRRIRLGDVLEHAGIDALRDELSNQCHVTSPSTMGAPLITSVDILGWTPLAGHEWALGVSTSMGRMTWQQLEGLALAARRWGDGSMRTSPSQSIVITRVKSEARESLAAELGRYNLTIHADSIARSVVTCTGRQFCDLGVVETKGTALRLVDQLRQRLLVMHGIRIQMSGCSSGCAQHRLADIGLKGIRIKRFLGVREGFDIYLGGGVAESVQLGLPYRLGIEPAELADVIMEVVRDYYLRHLPGQTFSSYWRTRLMAKPARDVRDTRPVWECQGCRHQHAGHDPPTFCPKCASLRDRFARLEAATSPPTPPAEWRLERAETAEDDNAFAGGIPVEGLLSAANLAEWMRKSAAPIVGEPRTNGRRGRPRDPSVHDRDKLIRQRQREYPHLSHKELARLVSDERSESITAHMVRNAIKRGPKP